MGWAEFVASIVKSTVWPSVVVVSILLFQPQIRDLLGSLSELKIGKDGVTGKWNRTAAKVWKGLGKADPKQYRTVQGKLVTAPLAADVQPLNTTRIVAAWSNVENTLRKKLDRTGGPHAGMVPAALIGEAAKRGVITETQAKSLRGLYALRNLAAHSEDDASDARANEYLAMADAMKTVLEPPT